MDNGTKLNVWNIEEQLLQSRIIKIDGEINTQMAQRVTSFLDVLANDDPNAVIKLEICSGGGSVLDGFAIVDKIREIPNPVVAFNTGICASMATIISSVCDYAYGSVNAQFMIHEIASGMEGKFRVMKNQLDFNERLNKRLFKILTEKTKKSEEELMKMATYDYWMDANEALDFGLIDAIRMPVKKNTKALEDFVKELNKENA